jgi:general secretion pathway protein J
MYTRCAVVENRPGYRAGRVSRSGQAGFTLIELVIALTLVALLLGLLFGGLRLANKSWDAADARNELAVEMRMVWRFIDQQLTQAVPVSRSTPEGSEAFFYGRSDGFEFVAPMPEHLGLGGYYVQRIEVIGSRGQGQLLYTRWLYNPQVLEGGGGIPPWQPISEAGGGTEMPEGGDDPRSYFSQSKLIDQLEGMEVEYFGATDPESQPGWFQKWGVQQIPQLVRIQIRARGRVWPVMVFRIGA